MLLDAEGTIAVETHLILGLGVTRITRTHCTNHVQEEPTDDSECSRATFVRLTDAKGVMEELAGLLRHEFRVKGGRNCSPMVKRTWLVLIHY